MGRTNPLRITYSLTAQALIHFPKTRAEVEDPDETEEQVFEDICMWTSTTEELLNEREDPD